MSNCLYLYFADFKSFVEVNLMIFHELMMELMMAMEFYSNNIQYFISEVKNTYRQK